MNKIKLTLLTAVMSVSFLSTFAQNTTLYAAGVTWDQDRDSLVSIDTTGGMFTVSSKMLITTDYTGGVVDGVYGMSLNPADNVMYIAYQTNDKAADTRRLGTIDLTTAVITDIGESGNLTEISFGADGNLYASLGSKGSNEFAQVDIATAAITVNHDAGTWGSTMGFDWLNNKMIYADASSYKEVDITGNSNTPITVSNHPGEINAMFFMSETISIVQQWGSAFEYNSNTMTFTSTTFPTRRYHAIAFGESVCNTVDNSTTLTGETISANYAGASYQWVDCNNSNAPISGATNADFTAVTNGNYAVEVTKGACVVTSECVNINSLVGVNEISNTTNSIYPNPNNGRFKVSNTEIIVSVSVIDITGKVIFTESNINSNSKEINLDNVNAGVYFVKTVTGSNNETFSKVTVK